MNIKFMQMALKEALKGSNEGEIPVGAIIVHKEHIISKTYNLKETLKCSTKHAEILAIEEASKYLDDWRLNECEMYVTMEPCIMCAGALIQSRIKKIYYLINNEKFGGINSIQQVLTNDQNNHIVISEQITDKKLQQEALDMLRKFFEEKR